jgi:hypothetical protein
MPKIGSLQDAKIGLGDMASPLNDGIIDKLFGGKKEGEEELPLTEEELKLREQQKLKGVS